MSSQKGNIERSRPQKYKNRFAFKNNLHDTSHKTKLINTIHVSDVCLRCKEIIDWKIKYKKYKPLTQAKTCVKCSQKTVRQAYHVMCGKCGRGEGLCTKCCKPKELVEEKVGEKEQMKLDNEMKNLLQSLPERKRRTFLRYLERKNGEKEERDEEEEREDLRRKLNALKVDGDEFEDLGFSDSDDE